MEEFKELDNETEEQRRQNASSLKSSMIELKESVHFRRFLDEIKKQIERRNADVFGFPTGGLDTVIKNIYTTGEIAGLRITLEYVDILIDFAQQTLDVSDYNERMRAEGKENG